MRVYCDVCQRYCAFVSWEFHLCDKHYDELNRLFRKCKKEMPLLNKFWNAKPCTDEWTIYCKLLEWISLEFIYKIRAKEKGDKI